MDDVAFLLPFSRINLRNQNEIYLLVNYHLLSFADRWFSSAQTITVIASNGGEILYACQQYPVTWSQTGSPSNYWNIDYSLDGGTIWASVTSNFLSTNGTFLWTVPNVQSTTVKLRIYDAQNRSTVDQSNTTTSLLLISQ